MVLGEVRELVEPARRTVVGELPEQIRRVAGYHAGWWDADGRPVAGGGKAVRPALTLACARAVGGEAATAAAVRAAVAVELVHDFSLLHDDVMDGDLTRRHRPAAWAVFGAGQAILVGDALLIAAVQQVAASGGDMVRALTGAVQELCRGQAADLAFEQRGDVGLAECVAMAEAKTGALLGAACELGALAAGASVDVAGRYRLFGRELGLAFQVVDDLLGIWGDPGETGKPVGADLARRKKSLPVVAALCSRTPEGDHLARLYGSRAGDLDERAAARLVEQAGGRSWARDEAARRTQAALDALDASDRAADLRLLAAYLTHRDR